MAGNANDGRQEVGAYFRFCPGEEHIAISDAVCIGRRRAGFARCPGCRFNDDEKSQAVSVGDETAGDGVRAEVNPMSDLATLVKAYDVRGTYPEPLNEEIAWRLGHATAQFLRSLLRGFDRAESGANRLAVGRDMRKSSPSLAAAFIEGARSTGAGVIDIGMVDTSQVYFAINHLKTCGGVQVTASHNPPQYNGFKVAGQKGKPIGADTGLPEIRRIAENMNRHDTATEGPLDTADLSDAYRDFIRSPLRLSRPLKVVVDASNGMAGKWLPILFDGVDNLELITLNMEHDGEFVHDPNPLVDDNLRQLQAEVKRTGADLGTCFDGDADRCMFIDEKAQIIRCDMLTALLAGEFLREVPGAAVVYDLRSSRVVAEEIERAGGKPVRQRVGHAYMKKAMADEDGVFAGELSGHFYFRDNWYCDSGFLAFGHALNVLSATSGPMSSLIKPLKRWYATGEQNFECENKDEAIEQLAELYAGAEIDFLDGITVQYKDWWFNVRKSNTEPLLRLNLEAKTKKLMTEKAEELAPHLGTPVAH